MSSDVAGAAGYSSPYLYTTGSSIFPEDRTRILGNFLLLALDKAAPSTMNTASLGTRGENHVH